MSVDLFQAVRRDGSLAINSLKMASDINVTTEDGQNLLHCAVAYRNDHAISYLLDSKIEVNHRDSKGQTPLHYAAAHQNVEAARTLLTVGADIAIVDKHGNTAVWTAAMNARGNYEVLELLIEFGGKAFAEQKNLHGRSPLDFAKQIGDSAMIQLLTSSK